MRYIHNLCSADEEDQPKGVNSIHNVSNKVETGHERDHHNFIPLAPLRAAGPVLEVVKRPDDHSCDVHQHCQHIAACQDFIKWCGEESHEAADGKNDDNDGKNEANAVDGYTPLEPWKRGVMLVIQADEDDAGHEGLHNLEEAWDCGQKSTDLTRFSPGQPDLNGVQDEGQKGSNSGTNIFATGRASVDSSHDRGCQHLCERKVNSKREMMPS